MAIADDALKGMAPENTILIGHSSGALLTLRMAERTKTPFKAIVLVSAFARDIGHPVFDPLNISFFHPPFDWKAVKQGTAKTLCFSGDDDPYVPPTHPQEIARALDTQLIVIKKGGHLNAEAGYLHFPALLEAIRELL